VTRKPAPHFVHVFTDLAGQRGDHAGMGTVRDSNRKLLQKGESVPAQRGIAYLHTTGLDELDEDFV
jgi:hypothetical protein